LFGLVYSPIVVTGLHQSFPAIELPLINDMANTGGSFIFPIATMANIAQGAATLAIFLRARDAKLRGMSGASAASALFGITEPAIFGVNLRLRWPFFTALIAAGVGGALVSVFDIRAQALGAAGLVGFVSIRPSDIPMYFLGASIEGTKVDETVETQEDQQVRAAEVLLSDAAATDFTVTSPLEGDAVALSSISDKTFASGMLGPGIAINPAGGPVVSPVDGEVLIAFPTGHAYGLRAASGVELLIHVGMDTVQLEGKHFTPKVSKGDRVSRGTVLAEVDWDAVRAAGFETITPVVVSNSRSYEAVEDKASGPVHRGDLLLVVEPAVAEGPAAEGAGAQA